MSDDPKKVVDLATVKRRKPDSRFDPVKSMSVDAEGVLHIETDAGRTFRVSTDSAVDKMLDSIECILGIEPEGAA